MDMELQFIDCDLAIAKLDKAGDYREMAKKARFFTLTKTEDEISLVIDSNCLPKNVFANDGWIAIKIVGPLEFSLVGILQKVIEPLSSNGISIFSISTFDTDYVLIKKEHKKRAESILSDLFVIRH